MWCAGFRINATVHPRISTVRRFLPRRSSPSSKRDKLPWPNPPSFDKVAPSLARRNAWFYRGSNPAPIFFACCSRIRASGHLSLGLFWTVGQDDGTPDSQSAMGMSNVRPEIQAGPDREPAGEGDTGGAVCGEGYDQGGLLGWGDAVRERVEAAVNSGDAGFFCDYLRPRNDLASPDKLSRLISKP